MWPECIKNLKPLKHPTLEDELPTFIINAFQDNGIDEISNMFVPIQMIDLLGKCGTYEYLECPNLPWWHSENPDRQLSERRDKYFWFDFNLLDAERKTFPLRAVFNEGYADCNDGTWGACWARKTEELVADFTSTGDGEATVSVSSSECFSSYKPHNIWFPSRFQNDYDAEPPIYDRNPVPFQIVYASDSELEILIALALRWCGSYAFG